ncbi:hypothetical protein [Nocardioides dongxiaopingii]|uniref:hypothetical protein n=1 Tax=Nocardioides dongxiaopingii TaxID=2576036 RepID=UPI0010C77094|nr:hypothetical protein [Nocardioides dongxiaopingii]
MTGDKPRGETFVPTSGRVQGVAVVLIGLACAVLAVVGDGPVTWWVVALGVGFAALGWAALLRPGVAVSDDTLVLRNIVHTVRIPLAAVEEVAVRQVLAVRAGERRYVSAAIGRGRRQLRRDDRAPRGGSGDVVRMAEESYGLFVEERIRQLAEQARATRGIKLYGPEQAALAAEVRREPAVPVIVLLAGSALALVVALVV